MLEQVEKNLGAVAEETVADGGYHSAEALGGAQERGLLVNRSQEAAAVKKRENFTPPDLTMIRDTIAAKPSPMEGFLHCCV